MRNDNFICENRTIRYHRIVQCSGVSSGNYLNITTVSKIDEIKTILLTATKWFSSDHFPDVRKMVCIPVFAGWFWISVCIMRQKFPIKAEFSCETAKSVQLHQFVDVNKMMGDINWDGGGAEHDE